MLTNPYVIALGIPLILLCCGALAKKLVRGTGWQQSDFYLGVEFTLSAMSAALVHIFDISKNGKGASTATPSTNSPLPAPTADELTPTGAYLAICFFLLLWILSTHQDWEKRSTNPNGQLIWLCGVSNFIGAGLLAAFILYVKGV